MKAKEYEKLNHNERMSYICKLCEPATKNRISIKKSQTLLKKLRL